MQAAKIVEPGLAALTTFADAAATGTVKFSNLLTTPPLRAKRAAPGTARGVQPLHRPDRVANPDLEREIPSPPTLMDSPGNPDPGIIRSTLAQQDLVRPSNGIAEMVERVSDSAAVLMTGLIFLLAALVGRNHKRRRSPPHRGNASSIGVKRVS
jgi:hypothetical protein